MAGILPPGGLVFETIVDDMAKHALEVISHASVDSVGSLKLVVGLPHLELPAGRYHRALSFLVHFPNKDHVFWPKVCAVRRPVPAGRRHSSEASAPSVPVDGSRGPVVLIANESILVPELAKHGAGHLFESISGNWRVGLLHSLTDVGFYVGVELAVLISVANVSL